MGQLKVITNNKEIQGELNERTISIIREIGNRSSVATFTYINYDDSLPMDVALNNDIRITHGGNVIFAGTITDIATSSKKEQRYKEYSITCNDYGYNLNKIIVNTRFVSSDLATIINELLQETTGGEYTLRTITGNIPIGSITLPRVSLSEALDRITELVGYSWVVDSNKRIIVSQRGTNLSGYSITNASTNFITDTFTLDEDTTQIRNSVIIRGGETPASSTIEYEWTADGTQSEFIPPVTREDTQGNFTPVEGTGYVFSGRPTIEKNTGSGGAFEEVDNGRMGIYGLSAESGANGYQVLWNSSGRFHGVVFSAGNIPDPGERVRITFTPEIPVLAIASDQVSISRYGLREYFDRDTTLISALDAQERAQAEIDTYKDPIKKIKFQTYATNIIVGETISVNYNRFDLDDTFLVQRTITKYHSGSNDDSDIVLITGVSGSSIKDVYLNDLFISLLSKRDDDEGDATPFIDSILNIRSLGTDQLDLADTDIPTPVKHGTTNKYVWSEATNTPTSPLVAGLYDRSVYNASTLLPSLTYCVYTPTFTDGALTSVKVDWGAPQATYEQYNKIILKYNSYYGDPLRTILLQGRSGSTGSSHTFTPSNLDDTDFFANLINDGEDVGMRQYRGASNLYIWGVHSLSGTSAPIKAVPNYVLKPIEMTSESAGATSITFSWRPSPSIYPVTYTIGRYKTGITTNLNAPDGDWETTTGITSISHTLISLPTDKAYTYRLRAEITTTDARITNKTSAWTSVNANV